MPELDPDVADEAPCPDSITPYDEAHFITYLRLLAAKVDGSQKNAPVPLAERRKGRNWPGQAARKQRYSLIGASAFESAACSESP